MKITDTHKKHLEELANLAAYDEPAITRRDRRYTGRAVMAFSADSVLDDYRTFTVNLCKLAVDAVAERIRLKEVAAHEGDNRDMTEAARRLIRAANFDETLNSLVTEALALGRAYALVWLDQLTGRPVVTAESCKQLTADIDPLNGRVTRAVKRWQHHTGRGVQDYAVLYLPHVITTIVGTGASAEVVEEIPNPLGEVPIVPLVNAARPGGRGVSVIDDMEHLVDALSKVLVDMLVTSEDVARPRRWATGVALRDNDHSTEWTADSEDMELAIGEFDEDEDEAASPFDEGNRMWTAESEAAKFGQLDGANLAGYRTAVDLLTQQISAVSGLPSHMLGVTTANPTSADAIRAAEAGLTARAEARINAVSVAVERVVALMLAMSTGRLPSDYQINAQFASPATRSTAQEADATTKLHALGIIDTQEARALMGIGVL